MTNAAHAPEYAQQAKDGCWRVKVWAQPGAKRDEVVGVLDGRLKVKLRAPAVDNKANEALIAYLAAVFCVSKSELELDSGQTSRKKTVRVRAGVHPAWPGAPGA